MELKQHITDEKTGISYTLQGDYYLPDLVLPEQESFSIGKYGRMHRRYLKEHTRYIINVSLILFRMKRVKRLCTICFRFFIYRCDNKK